MNHLPNPTPHMDTDEDYVNIRGVHRLAGAVLVQAIEDIRCGSGKKKEDAIRWVTDSSEEQFSFVFCCRMLNRDPEEVRRILIRQSIPDWLFANSDVKAPPPPSQVEAEEVETWR